MRTPQVPARRTIHLAVALAAFAMPLAVSVHAAPNTDSSAARATQDTSYALVQLNGDPLATYAKTRPAKGKKIDFSSSSVKSYRAQLAALRNDYKQWLRRNVPQASVTGEFDISLNAVSVKLNGATLAQVSATPLVSAAQYQGLYYPTAVDPDLALVKAVDAWNAAGGAATAGEGVKVAVVDSGIDNGHPCFSDAGYPAQPQLGDPRFTNNKVIAAKVFNNKTPSLKFTPEGINSHGTHVSGTVACNFGTPASVGGVAIPHPISGVAPRALLGSYNVFPGEVGNARSEDILNALEAAYADGFDIANMSLGGGASGIHDLVTIAVDNLDQANMVVAVAAGNSGPGFGTVESPGSAARALAAGAASVGHFVATPINVDGLSVPGMAGDFATVTSDLTAALAAVTEAPINAATGLGVACNPLSANSLTGKIALISRGTCSFSTKIRNAQNAGAVAALIANNVAGDGIGMAQDGTANQPTIPAYNVSRDDSAALKTKDGQSTTISATPQYFVSGNDDFMAGFSSWGPTDVDFRVKPDVVAPGVNVLSSIPRSFCGGDPCFAFFQGTSMATPHLAGSAAIVRQQHPDWSAAQVRSAIVNTADRGVLKPSSGANPVENNANVVGTGRENLLAAVNSKVALDPVSLSFGAVPSGSGQTLQREVVLTNVSGGSQTYALSIVEAVGAGVAFSVPGGSVTLASGESATVAVTLQAQKSAPAGHKQAVLRVSAGGQVIANAMLYTLIK